MKFPHRMYDLLAGFALVAATACSPTTPKEASEDYLDDTLITTKVKAAVFTEPTLKAAEINAETIRGIVQLSGFLSSQANIDKAIDLAHQVNGVVAVKNEMRLKRMATGTRTYNAQAYTSFPLQ